MIRCSAGRGNFDGRSTRDQLRRLARAIRARRISVGCSREFVVLSEDTWFRNAETQPMAVVPPVDARCAA